VTRIVAEDENTAVVFFVMTPQPVLAETVDGIIAAWQATNKPFVFVFDTGGMFSDSAQRAIEARLPFVRRIDDGLRTLDAMLGQRRIKTELALPPPSRPTNAGPLTQWPHGQLTESDAKALFQTYGIPVTREKVVSTAADALAFVEAIGFPVVIKGQSRTIIHKSDAGLVKLGLRNTAAVRKAFSEIGAALAEHAPGEPILVSVQEMVCGAAEFIVGTRYDSTYGPQILFGFGGLMVEVLKDVRTLPAPASAEFVEIMLRELRFAPLLNGVRTQPPLDVAALTDIVVRLSWLAADCGGLLQELDINPVIVKADGKGAVAVDGRATFV
jgi:acyl-CoA synthetase (NDP forming)